MTVLEWVSGSLMLIASIIIIVLIMGQETKQANGMDALSGGSGGDNFIGKNGAKTRDAYLGKITKVVAIVFFVVALLLNVFVHLGW